MDVSPNAPENPVPWETLSVVIGWVCFEHFMTFYNILKFFFKIAINNKLFVFVL